ncbi:TVG0993143 [Thermoplasma volcanium GSS1]|uniref:TVG0993143 protein n=1 Tax=Thermoplasma volcanium (strain ATCC 51530 / DSM 4299 / JCM 9571 / NBRC 15438 / GSS1) TaxID=273116 RepID=Q97A41_THEVO|nr:hypothetical protein [Thermoplasma volcanium]BAB60111.1 TVG0993143 [Thermoplasma volcanium GSS1]
MRQTLSFLILIFAVFASSMVVTTGIALQEQGMTSVAIVGPLTIKNIENVDSHYYLNVRIALVNRAYTVSEVTFYHDEVIVPALTSVQANVLIPLDMNTLLKSWPTHSVNITIPFEEHVFFVIFQKHIDLKLPKLFDNFTIEQNGSNMVLTVKPSNFTSGNTITVYANGNQKSGQLELGRSWSYEFTIVSNDSSGYAGIAISISNFTFYYVL